MFGRHGRFGLNNRHISHVRYVSLKRGRPRLFILAAFAMGLVVYYKTKLKNATPSVGNHRPGDMNVALGQGKDLNVHSKVNDVHPNRILEASPRKDRVSTNEFEWRPTPSWNCEKSSPFLIVLIASHVSNQETRDVIRNSWCRRKTFPEGRNVACVFLLAESEEEASVTQPSDPRIKKYRGHFEREFSRQFPELKSEITNGIVVDRTSMSGCEMGKCWSDEPNRNPKSRFYVSVDAYPQVGYPEYCSGAGYIMSGGIARRLLQASLTQTILPFDEVYAGVLLEKVGVAPTDVPGFLLTRFDESAPCRSVSSAVAIHVHGMDVKHVWSLLKNCNGGVR